MNMLSRQDKGRQAEELAVRFLERRGFKVLARNWRDRRGELDIIAREGNELCMVEVRSKSGDSPFLPEASLSPQKIARLTAAANRLLKKHRLHHLPLRLDLMVIDWDSREIKFYPAGIVPPSRP